MKRMIIATAVVFCLLLAFSAAGFAIDMGDIENAMGIGAPPRVEFAGAPELVPIPGRYVYFVPDIDFDLFFYHNQWYRPYKGRWFRSDNYAGPWEHVREVPPALIDLPPNYKTIPRGYSRIPYGELRNNWERWEREKYWDKRGEDRGIKEREREREERDVRPEREREGPMIEDRIAGVQRSIDDGKINGLYPGSEGQTYQFRLNAIRGDYLRMTEGGRYITHEERRDISSRLDLLEKDLHRSR